MAGKLTGLVELFDPGLELGGIPPQVEQSYRVPLPSAELGLWCRTVGSAGAAVKAATTPEAMESARRRFEDLPDMPAEHFAAAVLGTAYAEMVADGVADPHIQFCAATAYAWILGGCGETGEEYARKYWESGGRPGEAGARDNRATRRAAAKTSMAAAATTKRPASGSGTRSRTTSSGSAKAKRSTGSTS